MFKSILALAFTFSTYFLSITLSIVAQAEKINYLDCGTKFNCDYEYVVMPQFDEAWNFHEGLVAVEVGANEATLPEASTSQAQQVVQQRRPLFHDLSRVYTGPINDIIKVKQEPTRGLIGNWLEKVNILDPQQKVILSISNPCKDGLYETVLWSFPKGHYFPQNSEWDADEISVIAWRTFPVTAKVKCGGQDEFQTYTTWVEID